MASKTRAPGPGHNETKARDVSKELRALADRQIALDKKRRAANAKFSQENSEITGSIKELGKSRKSFNRAYEEYYLVEMAKDENERIEVRQKIVIEQADYHEIYKALNKGQQLNWLDVEKEAKKAREAIAESDGDGDVEEDDI